MLFEREAYALRRRTTAHDFPAATINTTAVLRLADPDRPITISPRYYGSITTTTAVMSPIWFVYLWVNAGTCCITSIYTVFTMALVHLVYIALILQTPGRPTNYWTAYLVPLVAMMGAAGMLTLILVPCLVL